MCQDAPAAPAGPSELLPTASLFPVGLNLEKKKKKKSPKKLIWVRSPDCRRQMLLLVIGYRIRRGGAANTSLAASGLGGLYPAGTANANATTDVNSR
jgi:hypothetical protein